MERKQLTPAEAKTPMKLFVDRKGAPESARLYHQNDKILKNEQNVKEKIVEKKLKGKKPKKKNSKISLLRLKTTFKKLKAKDERIARMFRIEPEEAFNLSLKSKS